MELHIHLHHHGLERLENKINRLIILTKKTMATLEEVTQKLAELQTAVDNEQQEIANALALLQDEVQRLTDIIAAGVGATPEQLQTVVDTINVIISDVKATIPNLPEPELGA